MKAVNRIFLFLLITFSSACVTGEIVKEGKESIEYVHQKIVIITGELEKNIERCFLVRRNSMVPKIDLKKIKSFGIDKKSIAHGLYYLSNRNFENCEGRKRMELAYQLGILKSLGEHYNVELPPIDNIKRSLIYPTNRDIESEITFNKLPKEVQKYILDSVGDEPFDLIKTVSQNKILEE